MEAPSIGRFGALDQTSVRMEGYREKSTCAPAVLVGHIIFISTTLLLALRLRLSGSLIMNGLEGR